MGRGFLTGLIYGAGLSAASLVGVTLVIPFASPMPELGIAPAPAEAPAAPASEAPAAEAPAAEAASAPAAAPEAAAPEAAPEAAPGESAPEPASEAVAALEPAPSSVQPAAPVAADEGITPQPAPERLPEPSAETLAPAAEPAPVPEVGTATAQALSAPEGEGTLPAPAAEAAAPVAPQPEAAAPAVPDAPATPDLPAPADAASPAAPETEAEAAAPSVRSTAPEAPAALIASEGAAPRAPEAEAAVPVPPPGEAGAPDLPPQPAPDAAPVASATPAPAPAEVASAPQPEPQPTTEPVAPEPVAPEPATPEPASPEPATPEPVAPEPATPDAVPAEPAPAEPAALPEIIPGAPASEPEPEIIPAPGAAPLAPAPQPGFATVPSSRLPQIGGGDAAPADGAVSPEAPAAVTPRIIAVAPSAPQPGFNRSVPGVKINRLPAVGAAGAGAGAPPIGGNTEGEGAAGAVLPEAGPKPALPGKPLILTAPKAEPVDPALTRFAAAFANPDGRPLLAVVLRDSGDAAALTAARTLAAAGVALTLAVDPLGSDPAARAAAFRAAGLEVALDLPVLPADATASDLEVAYEGAIGLVPGAVAVIASPDAAFQSDRQTAQHLVSMLAPEGLGLVTWSRGLNPALQAAERESVPAMAIYRDLDSGGESPETIARSLDRAAFEAERVGRVVLFGHADAATVGALVQWQARGGKAAILGPVSAALGDGGGSGGGG